MVDHDQVPLMPAPHPIGVLQHYTQHGTPIALKIRERGTFKKDNFDITDAVTGATVLHVDGKKWSMHHRKEMSDHAGNPLFKIHQEMWHVHSTFKGSDPNDQELFSVKQSWGLRVKLALTYRNTMTGQDEELVLKGDFFDRKAEITCNGVPVGHISRRWWNAGQFFFDNQTYILTVAPGVDCALLAAFCVCLDEIEKERKNATMLNVAALSS